MRGYTTAKIEQFNQKRKRSVMVFRFFLLLICIFARPQPLLSGQLPLLHPIGNKVVEVGRTLSFTVSATASEGRKLSYFAYNLPKGAKFDPEKQAFQWTPTHDQVGVYQDIHFEVTDGLSSPVLRNAGIIVQGHYNPSDPNSKYISGVTISGKKTTWAVLQPKENGPINFELLKRLMKPYVDQGLKVTLNFPFFRPPKDMKTQLPSWLEEKLSKKGAVLIFNRGSEKETHLPVYWDPVYQTEREKFIQSLSNGIESDPYFYKNILYINFGEVIIGEYGHEISRSKWHKAAVNYLSTGQELTDERFINDLILKSYNNFVDVLSAQFHRVKVGFGLNYFRKGDQYFIGIGDASTKDIEEWEIGDKKKVRKWKKKGVKQGGEHPEDIQAFWNLVNYMVEKGLKLHYPGLRQQPVWREIAYLYPVFTRYSGHTQISMRSDFPERKGENLLTRFKQAFEVCNCKVNYLEVGRFFVQQSEYKAAFEYAKKEMQRRSGHSVFEDITIKVISP